MRSRCPSAWNTALIVLSACVGAGNSGCQVGRTFFQMDSNAPVPFFGMDLLPKRDTQSPTSGVSRFQNAEPSDVRQTTYTETASTSTTKAPKGWSGLLGRAPRQQSLALPASKEDGQQTLKDAPVEQFR